MEKHISKLGYLSLLLCFGLFGFEAAACSVCGFGQEGSKWAFIFTTVFLSFLPLAMAGAGVYWLRKKYATRSDNSPASSSDA